MLALRRRARHLGARRGGTDGPQRPRRDQRRQRDGGAAVQRHPHGHRGQPLARAPHDGRGREALLRAVVDRGSAAAPTPSSRPRSGCDAHSPLLAQLAGRRHLSRPPLALSPAALGARAEGPDVHAHGRAAWRRRRPRCRRRPAANATGTTATAGCATPPSRCGRCTRSTSTGRPTTSSQYVADMERNEDGSLQIMYGIKGEMDLDRVDARPPQRLRGGAPGADRQRRLQAAPERRLRRGARLGLPALQEARPHPRAAVAGAHRPGPLRGRRLARTRPGDLGGARRAAPLRLLEADVLGRDGPRRAAGRTARQRRGRRKLAGDRRRDPRRDPRARRRRTRRLPPALRHRRARRLDAAGAAVALPAAPTTSACARP